MGFGSYLISVCVVNVPNDVYSNKLINDVATLTSLRTFKFIITPGVFKFLAIFKISFNRGTCVEGKVEKRTGGLKRIS